MGRFLVVVSFAAILGTTVVGGGCSHDSNKSGGGAMAASKDDCPHCPGIQKATADGRCPECGMQVVNK